MARKIRTDLEGVVFAHYDDGTPHSTPLAAGDDVPDGLRVGPHLLDGGSDPEPEDPGDEGDQGQDDQDDDGHKDDDKAGDDKPGPKGNASREEWAAHADSLGVTYAEDAKREDIKAAVAAAS